MPKIITYLFQAMLTFGVLWVVYMVLALTDYNSGFNSFADLLVFQPITGAILSILTILACSLIGLPIRLNKEIRTWWVNRPYIPILCIIVAFVLMIVAFLPSQMTWTSRWEKDYEVHEQIPNLYFLATGWFAIGFSLLHIYPLGYILAKGKE